MEVRHVVQKSEAADKRHRRLRLLSIQAASDIPPMLTRIPSLTVCNLRTYRFHRGIGLFRYYDKH